METFEIKLITYGSKEYTDELALRDEVLRRPLGLCIKNDDLSAEGGDFHIGGFANNRLCGVVVLTPTATPGDIKMRQVAVHPALRGRGCGALMARFAQRLAAEQGFRRIVLHARKTAVPFYEKLGYHTQGGEFIEVTIPHRAMWLELGPDGEPR